MEPALSFVPLARPPPKGCWPTTAPVGLSLMCEEVFGPVVGVHVYPDARWEETLGIVDRTSPEWGASKLRRYGEKFPLDQVNIGIYPVENELKTIIAGVYQFCVQNRTADSQVKVCSPYYAKDLRGRSRLSRKTRSEFNTFYGRDRKCNMC